jgi:ABC-type uncharacterized transport system fused permease/ATPase subunit
MNKNTLLIVGFALFVMGFLSIILSLVGLKLDVIGFLFKIGSGFAFLIHILLVCSGLSLMYVGKNLEKRKAEMQAEETPQEV